MDFHCTGVVECKWRLLRERGVLSLSPSLSLYLLRSRATDEEGRSTLLLFVPSGHLVQLSSSLVGGRLSPVLPPEMAPKRTDGDVRTTPINLLSALYYVTVRAVLCHCQEESELSWNNILKEMVRRFFKSHHIQATFQRGAHIYIVYYHWGGGGPVLLRKESRVYGPRHTYYYLVVYIHLRWRLFSLVCVVLQKKWAHFRNP